MITIRRDNTVRKEKWFAVTDKGFITGGTKDIVERKIARLGAKEKVYKKDYINQENINIDYLPF